MWDAATKTVKVARFCRDSATDAHGPLVKETLSPTFAPLKFRPKQKKTHTMNFNIYIYMASGLPFSQSTHQLKTFQEVTLIASNQLPPSHSTEIACESNLGSLARLDRNNALQKVLYFEFRLLVRVPQFQCQATEMEVGEMLIPPSAARKLAANSHTVTP